MTRRLCIYSIISRRPMNDFQSVLRFIKLSARFSCVKECTIAFSYNVGSNKDPTDNDALLYGSTECLWKLRYFSQLKNILANQNTTGLSRDQGCHIQCGWSQISSFIVALNVLSKKSFVAVINCSDWTMTETCYTFKTNWVNCVKSVNPSSLCVVLRKSSNNPFILVSEAAQLSRWNVEHSENSVVTASLQLLSANTGFLITKLDLV